MINKSVVSYSLILVLSALLSVAWAQTEEESAPVEEVQNNEDNLAETECIPQAQIDLMSDDNVEKLELPVCDEGEAATESEDSSSTIENMSPETNSVENDSTVIGNEAMAAANEVVVEESTFPSANESLYEDQKSSD